MFNAVPNSVSEAPVMKMAIIRGRQLYIKVCISLDMFARTRYLASRVDKTVIRQITSFCRADAAYGDRMHTHRTRIVLF